MLCIAGKRIATPVCALVRNDTVFDTIRRKSDAKCYENAVIARLAMQAVAIRNPGI